MELKVKSLKWSAGLPVVMIHKGTAERMGIFTLERIKIKKSSKELISVVDIIEKLIKEDEIMVTSEVREKLKIKRGDKVDIRLAPPPKSFSYIKEKLNGKELSREKIKEIIKDVVNNALSEAEIALFLSATYKVGMNFNETVYLIEAMLETGKRLSFPGKLVVDKHSIGGIPGNRTTPLVVSICAAAGLTMPKTSSRAITSPAGTADVIEAIAKVEFSHSGIMKIVKKTNACMVWGGTLELAPADEKLIQIERDLKIDPESQLLASILSKKFAVGSKCILIDIPYGKGAKVTKKHAIKLKNKFEKIAKYFHKNIRCVLTDGSQPIGNGIGPILELKDVFSILKNNQDKPLDLERKALFLAGVLLEMSGKAKKGEGLNLAKGILYSGKALKKFEEIIKAQKGHLNHLALAEFKKDISAGKTGKIAVIDNLKITSLARIAGCPEEKKAGLYLYFHVGKKVKKGEKIITIFAESKNRLKEAEKFWKSNKIILIK